MLVAVGLLVESAYALVIALIKDSTWGLAVWIENAVVGIPVVIALYFDWKKRKSAKNVLIIMGVIGIVLPPGGFSDVEMSGMVFLILGLVLWFLDRRAASKGLPSLTN